jgi:hypothetical protein
MRDILFNSFKIGFSMIDSGESKTKEASIVISMECFLKQNSRSFYTFLNYKSFLHFSSATNFTEKIAHSSTDNALTGWPTVREQRSSLLSIPYIFPYENHSFFSSKFFILVQTFTGTRKHKSC